MTLYEKILAIYPELTPTVEPYFNLFSLGKIQIQNDSDGRGDYIAKWEHPTLPRPTQEQLDAVTGA